MPIAASVMCGCQIHEKSHSDQPTPVHPRPSAAKAHAALAPAMATVSSAARYSQPSRTARRCRTSNHPETTKPGVKQATTHSLSAEGEFALSPTAISTAAITARAVASTVTRTAPRGIRVEDVHPSCAMGPVAGKTITVTSRS